MLKLPLGAYDLRQARVIIPQLAGAVILNDFQGGDDPISFYGANKIAIRYLAGGPSRLRTFDLDGSHGGDVPIPAISNVSEVGGGRRRSRLQRGNLPHPARFPSLERP